MRNMQKTKVERKKKRRKEDERESIKIGDGNMKKRRKPKKESKKDWRDNYEDKRWEHERKIQMECQGKKIKHVRRDERGNRKESKNKEIE